MGTGHDTQHAHTIRPHTVRRSQQGGRLDQFDLFDNDTLIPRLLALRSFISLTPSSLQLIEDAPFYSESDSDEEEEDRSQTSSKGSGKAATKKKPYVMDPDHRLLLRNCKPLLQSRNASVSHVIVT